MTTITKTTAPTDLFLFRITNPDPQVTYSGSITGDADIIITDNNVFLNNPLPIGEYSCCIFGNNVFLYSVLIRVKNC